MGSAEKGSGPVEPGVKQHPLALKEPLLESRAADDYISRDSGIWTDTGPKFHWKIGCFQVKARKFSKFLLV